MESAYSIYREILMYIISQISLSIPSEKQGTPIDDLNLCVKRKGNFHMQRGLLKNFSGWVLGLHPERQTFYKFYTALQLKWKKLEQRCTGDRHPSGVHRLPSHSGWCSLNAAQRIAHPWDQVTRTLKTSWWLWKSLRERLVEACDDTTGKSWKEHGLSPLHFLSAALQVAACQPQLVSGGRVLLKTLPLCSYSIFLTFKLGCMFQSKIQGKEITQGSFWLSLAGTNTAKSHSSSFVNGSACWPLIANIRPQQQG